MGRVEKSSCRSALFVAAICALLAANASAQARCGTGTVTSVAPVGGSCSAFTPAVGGGPDNYEVAEGGTYRMTIEGVTECSGSTITVFVQSSSSGNFCFNATGGSGTYVGEFTLPDPTCNTMPVSYKCGAGAPCTNPNSFRARGPTSDCGGVHLRAATFGAGCVKTGHDTDCGGPPPTGACCLPDGACVEVTEADCLAQGGTYQGDSSPCSGVTCPQPEGACCLANGTCVEVTEADCLAQGGTYQGDSSLCSGVTCPQPEGACCLTDGTCVEVTEADCLAVGGTYTGDSSLCSGVTCPLPEGACCLDALTCVEVTEEECLTLGGIYHGDASLCASTDCEDDFPGCTAIFALDFETDDAGNSMAHGTKVDTEYDGGPSFPVTVTGTVKFSGLNTAAILNSTTGPALVDPDLLVGKGNILILQTDANLTECPPGSGIYCSHNDDENGGTLSFAFNVLVTPASIVLVDIDATDATSTVVLTDVNGKTRTFTVLANWTGDLVENGPPGYKTLDLTTLANQPGFASTVTTTEQAGFDGTAVVQIDVNFGGSGAIDDLQWCQDVGAARPGRRLGLDMRRPGK